jgi:hypothetical protein
MSTNNNLLGKETRPIWKSTDFSIKKVSGDKLKQYMSNSPSEVDALSLQSKGIQKIEDFKGFDKLRRLDLSENQLKRLSGMSTLSELSLLNVSKNSLDADASLEELRYLAQLRTLNIGENLSIKEIRSYIMKPLKNLQALIANQCSLTSCSFLRHLIGLNTLILSRNLLSSLNVQSLVNIRKLSLGHNSFSSFPDLQTLEQLQELRINNNSIDSIPISLLKNKRLKVLDISHNKISVWENIDLLTQLNCLTNLNMRENPLPVPPKSAEAAEIREDKASEADLSPDELLYRRFVLSKFQKKVGSQGKLKVQLIVLDMKRVKMKFSHNFIPPESADNEYEKKVASQRIETSFLYDEELDQRQKMKRKEPDLIDTAKNKTKGSEIEVTKSKWSGVDAGIEEPKSKQSGVVNVIDHQTKKKKQKKDHAEDFKSFEKPDINSVLLGESKIFNSLGLGGESSW